jgi:acetamidase/formamidase
MKRLRTGSVHYTLSPFHKPVLTISPGETVVVETVDAFGGRIKSERDLPTEKVAIPYGNPVTGPIYVEDARKGDVLIVDIKGIKPRSAQGATCLIPGFGGLTGTSSTRLLCQNLPAVTRICPIKNGKVYFSEKLALPYEPMIGTIGTAPELEAVSSMTPGPHGGNMNCPDVCVGNRLLLPVSVEGGLLFMGDVHAVQGDGEVCGVAVEIPAEITATVDVVKGRKIAWPRVESSGEIMAIGSAKPMEDAARIAFTELILWLERDYRFDRLEAYMLCTQAAKVRLAQMVDPLYTVVAKFPKKYLPKKRR